MHPSPLQQSKEIMHAHIFGAMSDTLFRAGVHVTQESHKKHGSSASLRKWFCPWRTANNSVRGEYVLLPSTYSRCMMVFTYDLTSRTEEDPARRAIRLNLLYGTTTLLLGVALETARFFSHGAHDYRCFSCAVSLNSRQSKIQHRLRRLFQSPEEIKLPCVCTTRSKVIRSSGDTPHRF